MVQVLVLVVFILRAIEPPIQMVRQVEKVVLKFASLPSLFGFRVVLWYSQTVLFE